VTVLVTGAAGYLGGRLVRHLRRAGVPVRAAVRRPVGWLGGRQVAADLCAAPLGPLVEGVEAVVHLAAPDEVAAAADPDAAVADTVTATRRLAEAAAEAGVGRFVYLSTVHVYGAALAPGAVVDETTVPEPRHPYGIAHLAAEHTAAAAFGDLVVLRLANAVGAPAHPDVTRWTLVANDLCRQAATTGRLVLRTHGMQWRDFVTVADACRVIAAACDPATLPAGTYNVASGRPLTVRELAGLVADAAEVVCGTRPPLVAPDPPAEPPGPHHVSAELLAKHGLRATGALREAVVETMRFCARAFGCPSPPGSTGT
jgi:UDP-glucose 4-epimerase